ncbi:hypothetical protein [Paraburkholderia sp. MM6662-R1]|uniref:hypothetical protein n=1 Tax=Paraburkholderia sp. MM6662-R1 TaxID=2991066 RepID=UPI003D2628B8
MQLVSLQFVSRGVNGWESRPLRFGERTTSLFARNGSGKTPLIQAIGFCLGFSTTFREDIREHCSSIVLTFSHGDSLIEARRELTSSECHITTRAGDVAREFFSEGEFSTALFQTLGMSPPLLVSTQRVATRPYISTVLPIFYVKQDGGYLDPYSAPSSFIQDQFVEMIRFVFGLAPKRSYSAQKDLLDAKDELIALQRRIVNQQKAVADLSERVDDSPVVIDLLNSRSQLIGSQLAELRESMNSEDVASNALRDLVIAKEQKLRVARREFYELSTRIASIDSIRAEIEGEIQTLSFNEQSRRAFEAFGEICSRPDCGLFLSSSDSYGKNLMYLKDQIKDLEANTARAEVQLEVLEHRIQEDEAERQLIVSKMEAIPKVTSTDNLIVAVQELTKELLDIEQKRAAAEVLAGERRKYVQLDSDRGKLQDKIELLNNNVRGEIEFQRLRAGLRSSLVRWMDILQTLNVSREIEIDFAFRFTFGTEPLSIFTGSTRSRLVLAIHAALFEAYLQDQNRPFRFLILDTPKQHELDGADLTNYLTELHTVCNKYGGQLIVSSTEYRHAIGPLDAEWLPSYPGAKQPMYLGKPGTHFFPTLPTQ